MTDDILERVRERGERNTFWQTVGLGVIAAEEGAADLRFQVRDDLRNGPGASLHGGVLAAAIDAAVAAALATTIPEDTAAGSLTSTLDLNVSFLAPATSGTLTVRGRILRRGRSLAFGQADVFDDKGTHIATGRATYNIRSPQAS
jgi:acyl-CoA thioesterase